MFIKSFHLFLLNYVIMYTMKACVKSLLKFSVQEKKFFWGGALALNPSLIMMDLYSVLSKILLDPRKMTCVCRSKIIKVKSLLLTLFSLARRGNDSSSDTTKESSQTETKTGNFLSVLT